MKKVSIIIPCYNEEQSLPLLFNALTEVMNEHNEYEWEVVMINDGSKDNTISIIKSLREKDSRFCFLDLSRNFGKENAMLAGFDNVSGDCVVIMDADMQHPPKLIPDMLRLWEQGFDDVYAERSDRGKESFMRRHLTMLYYKMLQKMAHIDILTNVGDFRLLDRKCIVSMRQLRETQRYTKGLFCWIGFKKTSIKFKQGDRTEGKSSFSYVKLVNLAIEGMTSYSTAPLRFSTVLGSIVSVVAFLYMCYVLIKTIFVGETVQGYPTLIIVILFMGGIQLLSLGIIGEYLGRIFYETKRRPTYIINEKEGL